MKKIFIMNLGTTSFKFKLYHVQGENMDVRASGEIESFYKALGVRLGINAKF